MSLFFREQELLGDSYDVINEKDLSKDYRLFFVPSYTPDRTEIAAFESYIGHRVRKGKYRLLCLETSREMRLEANRLIHKYLSFKDLMQQSLAEAHNNIESRRQHDRIIGVHCRGPAATDGGEDFAVWKWGCKDVPYDKYFQHIDAEEECDILVCSDAEIVIETFIEKYGNRVIATDASRGRLGEAHIAHLNRPMRLLDGTVTKLETVNKDGPTLAHEALLDCYLLSLTDKLICGSSNLGLYCSYANPDFEVVDVFAELYR